MVHLTLAALFLFSAKRKKTILLTRTTEEPLVSGNESMIFTFMYNVFIVCQCLLHQRKSSLDREGGSGGVSDFWLAAQQVLYGGVWIYFLYVLVSEAK